VGSATHGDMVEGSGAGRSVATHGDMVEGSGAGRSVATHGDMVEGSGAGRSVATHGDMVEGSGAGRSVATHGKACGCDPVDEGLDDSHMCVICFEQLTFDRHTATAEVPPRLPPARLVANLARHGAVPEAALPSPHCLIAPRLSPPFCQRVVGLALCQPGSWCASPAVSCCCQGEAAVLRLVALRRLATPLGKTCG